MRSRYTAYALGHADHIWRTWHPATRPERVTIDPTTTWTGLTVLRTVSYTHLTLPTICSV